MTTTNTEGRQPMRPIDPTDRQIRNTADLVIGVSRKSEREARREALATFYALGLLDGPVR